GPRGPPCARRVRRAVHGCRGGGPPGTTRPPNGTAGAARQPLLQEEGGGFRARRCRVRARNDPRLPPLTLAILRRAVHGCRSGCPAATTATTNDTAVAARQPLLQEEGGDFRARRRRVRGVDDPRLPPLPPALLRRAVHGCRSGCPAATTATPNDTAVAARQPLLQEEGGGFRARRRRVRARNDP